MNIETKVQAGTAAAFVSGIIIWALQTWVFKGSAVPPGAISLVYAVVPALLTLAAGYKAPHTHRPDLAPVVAAEPAVPPIPPPVVPK